MSMDDDVLQVKDLFKMEIAKLLERGSLGVDPSTVASGYRSGGPAPPFAERLVVVTRDLQCAMFNGKTGSFLSYRPSRERS